MNDSIQAIMEQASQSLAKMHYLESEADCLRALALAREEGDWTLYARILLPLQEVRRQRRMTAADGWILLGCEKAQDALDAISQHGAGCVAFTRPITPEQARDLSLELSRRKLYIEMLYVDSAAQDDPWQVTAWQDTSIRAARPAPPKAWRNKVILPGQPLPESQAKSVDPHARPNRGIEPTPADWFIDSTEALGDAALATVTAPIGSLQRVEQLEACLQVVVDHEILHQELAKAARALA